MDIDIINHLGEFLTDKRLGLYKKVLSQRTDYTTVVLEDIYQPHNASAVLRSCDCFGVQQVNIIENRNSYKVNPEVAMGATKWLDLHYHNQKDNNTLDTINKLKSQGYRIIATTPHSNDVDLADFDVHKGKFALMFGTEHTGLSDIAIENADEFLKIPMYGFTESFNISVSAALIMHQLTEKLRNSDIPWQLSEERYNQLLFDWLTTTLKRSGKIIEEYKQRESTL